MDNTYGVVTSCISGVQSWAVSSKQREGYTSDIPYPHFSMRPYILLPYPTLAEMTTFFYASCDSSVLIRSLLVSKVASTAPALVSTAGRSGN